MVTLESIDGALFYGVGPIVPVGPDALDSLRTINPLQEDGALIEATLRTLWRQSTGCQWPSMRDGAKVYRMHTEVIAAGNGWRVSWRFPGWQARQDEAKATIEATLDARRAGRPHHG